MAAAVGGLTTVVRHEHSGLLVEGHEPRAWAAALRRVIEDDDLRVRLEAGALEQARRFAWEHTAARTLDVYERARSLMRESVS